MPTLCSVFQLQASRVEWRMPRIALLGLTASLASFSIVTILATPVQAACRWDGTFPFCAGECKADEIQVLGSEYGGGGGIPNSGQVCATGTKVYCCKRCPSGLVWRDRFKGDALCVTPDERYRLEDGTCRSGYVWRDTFPGDLVCVTPAERAAAKAKAPPPSSAQTPPPSPPKPVKALGKLRGVKANNDVEIYDVPVEPRKVIGVMRGNTWAIYLNYHPDGWCQLRKFESTEPAGVSSGWVAEDHLTTGTATAPRPGCR